MDEMNITQCRDDDEINDNDGSPDPRSVLLRCDGHHGHCQ